MNLGLKVAYSSWRSLPESGRVPEEVILLGLEVRKISISDAELSVILVGESKAR